MRDRALFDLAIDSKLRGCDLVRIKIGTLFTGQNIRTRATVIQQKTVRPVQFEITAEVRASLLSWLRRRGGTIDDRGGFSIRRAKVKRFDISQSPHFKVFRRGSDSKPLKGWKTERQLSDRQSVREVVRYCKWLPGKAGSPSQRMRQKCRRFFSD